jgi:hypothetical protein
MSRVRTGVTPGAWRVEEPAAPGRVTRSYASVAVSLIPDMRPVLTYGGIKPNQQFRTPKDESR